MLSQVNAVRAKAGKSALQLSDQLNSFAQEHSDYQDSIKSMTHSDPSGSLGTRFVAAGISWTGAAENVAVGQQDVSAVVQAWVNSPDHYANMIGDYTYAGFGENNLYWTQDFLGTA
ncbi:SCP-like extracellular [Martensiomyces pterosporus]|nr:SCP-like extracellular [Martensiomyces pterosporus]